jgi:enoyl-CoA hydratase/carnithine racemase
MTEHLLRERDGATLTLRLNRPEKKNALTPAMYDGLAQGLRDAAADDGVRVVLIAGGADFTAGNDLADFAKAGDGTTRPSSAFEFLRVIRTFEKPVVAAVRGVAIGIGTTMLLHCDAAVAARDAKFQMPFARLGLVPEGGSSLLLAQRVGQARANWWLLSGEAFSGAEAAEAGLALRAVDDAAVEAEAARLAAQLAALPPGALAETKRLLRGPQAATLEAVMDAERASFSARLKTPEAQAIFAAFFERKKAG